MIQDTADTRDQRKDTACAVDQVHNARGDVTGYSGYWWLVRGDHKTRYRIHQLLGTRYSSYWGPDTGCRDCWGAGSQGRIQ